MLSSITCEIQIFLFWNETDVYKGKRTQLQNRNFNPPTSSHTLRSFHTDAKKLKFEKGYNIAAWHFNCCKLFSSPLWGCDIGYTVPHQLRIPSTRGFLGISNFYNRSIRFYISEVFHLRTHKTNCGYRAEVCPLVGGRWQGCSCTRNLMSSLWTVSTVRLVATLVCTLSLIYF